MIVSATRLHVPSPPTTTIVAQPSLKASRVTRSSSPAADVSLTWCMPCAAKLCVIECSLRRAAPFPAAGLMIRPAIVFSEAG